MPHTHCTIPIFLESKTSILDKIKAIDALIDAMFLKMVTATDGKNVTIDEYSMDDGQMKVRTSFRSISDIEKGITGLERLKNRYVNKFNGRDFVLRDVRGVNR